MFPKVEDGSSEFRLDLLQDPPHTVCKDSMLLLLVVCVYFFSHQCDTILIGDLQQVTTVKQLIRVYLFLAPPGRDFSTAVFEKKPSLA